jgi:hypothetical protein
MAIVQPIQYLTPDTSDPLAQGIQAGAMAAQARAMQQQATAKAAEIAQKREEMRAFRIEQGRFMGLAKPTAADILRLTAVTPEYMQKTMGDLLGAIPKEQRAAYMRSMGEVVSAIEADKVPVAVRLLRERGLANPDEAESARRLANMIQADPANAMKIIGPVIASDESGRDMLKSIEESNAARRTAAEFPVLMAQRAAELAKAGSDAEKAAVDAKYAERLTQAQIAQMNRAGQPVNFKILKPEDMKSRFGITVPENTVYKENTNTGEISAIGGAGVTVKMPPNIGNIPPDYRMVYDEAGNPARLEVIPGSKTARQLESEAKTELARQEGRAISGIIVVDDATRLRDLVKNQSVLNPVTGISGRAAERVLGSNRMAAQAMLDSMKANIGFDRLAAMRAESPSGGALGAITERELAFLQSVLGSLSLDMPDDVLIENIDRILNIYKIAAAYPPEIAAKYGFAKITQSEDKAGAPAPTPAPTPAPSPTPTAPPPGAVVRVPSPAPAPTAAPSIPPMPQGAVRRVQ